MKGDIKRKLLLILAIVLVSAGIQPVSSVYAAGYGATSQNDALSSIVTTNVVAGKVRQCIQASGDDHFVTSHWKSDSLNIVSKAGGYCNRASFSMCMSYLGVDCTPVHMQELGEVDTSANYKKVLANLNKEKGTKIVRTTASSFSSSTLTTCYQRFNSDLSYSPVYIWGNYTYNGKDGTHAMIIIGKEKENDGITRYIVLDPSSASHAQNHVIWMDFDTSTGKCVGASVAKYSNLKISLILQWKNENVTNEITVVDNTLRIGISTKKKTGNTSDDQCYIKDTPYEAGTTRDVIAKGEPIDIVGSVKNKHGNTWYKTSDGNYVYSGDVTVYAYGNLFNISATFKNTEKRESHVAPYLDSPDANTIKKNDAVTVTKFVVNEKGNIWAKLSDDSYLCFYDVDTKENKLTFLDADISTSSVTKPTGDIPLKKSFGLRGTITADAPILSVTAQVTNRSTGKVAVGPVTANVSAYNSYVNKITLNQTVNGTNINDKMGFSKLSDAGYYHYEVIVQLGFPYVYDGHTFVFGEKKVVISSDFTAGNPEGEELLPDIPDTPNPPVSPLRLPGDANDDSVVNILDALLTLQYSVGWDVEINLLNADVNADDAVTILDALLILQYSVGWDIDLL